MTADPKRAEEIARKIAQQQNLTFVRPCKYVRRVACFRQKRLVAGGGFAPRSETFRQPIGTTVLLLAPADRDQ